ncbi:MAG: hypothetical protein POG74_09095 [Acidocella sp.]|nr:hypothetical protein [Acidocella sp.]
MRSWLRRHIIRRLRSWLLADVMRELNFIQSRLDRLDELPLLSKNIEAALLTLATHQNSFPPAQSIPSNQSNSSNRQSPSA